MKWKFTIDEINQVKESFKYSVIKFEGYQQYPDREYKIKRIFEFEQIANSIINKMKHHESKKRRKTKTKFK